MPVVKKRRKQWRGTDRGRLRLLQRAILMMSAREQRVAAFEAATATFGTYFDNTIDRSITTAMQLLSDRIDACLVATE